MIDQTKMQVFQNHYLEKEKISFFNPCDIKWKFYIQIQTYWQIIWVNLNMVAIIFFPSGRPNLANNPVPLSVFVHFCLTTLPPNVRTSFMDGPFIKILLMLQLQWLIILIKMLMGLLFGTCLKHFARIEIIIQLISKL